VVQVLLKVAQNLAGQTVPRMLWPVCVTAGQTWPVHSMSLVYRTQLLLLYIGLPTGSRVSREVEPTCWRTLFYAQFALFSTPLVVSQQASSS